MPIFRFARPKRSSWTLQISLPHPFRWLWNEIIRNYGIEEEYEVNQIEIREDSNVTSSKSSLNVQLQRLLAQIHERWKCLCLSGQYDKSVLEDQPFAS